MAVLYDEIPSLDLADFRSGDSVLKSKFVQDLGEAYENIGFVAIRNHDLSDDIQNNLYEVIQNFFAQHDELKSKYERPELHGQRGYISKGKEKAKGQSVADLKEFYHVGQMVEDDDPIKEDYPDNVWPEEIEGFEKSVSTAYKSLQNTGYDMMKAIALHLGLEENHFEPRIKNGNSILRPIHYFPLTAEDLANNAVRAAEHGDINLITLLMGASAEGLEVKRVDGKWIPITALPDQIIVNVGDMLERYTNDKLKSTIHRVVNPPNAKLGTSRFSIPFFLHPRMEMELNCLPSCITTQNPKKHKDITAGDFLMERLREIGLA